MSESSSKFAKVVTVEAKDPESDPVRYSIVGGNDEDIFQVKIKMELHIVGAIAKKRLANQR